MWYRFLLLLVKLIKCNFTILFLEKSRKHISSVILNFLFYLHVYFVFFQIYDTLVFQKIKYRDFNNRWKAFHFLKKSTENKFQQKKKHLRHILIDRVELHQEFRNESRCCFFTATHKQIMLDLFELAVSRYSEVRAIAQLQLFNMISTFPYCYTVLQDRIKEILQLNPMEHHEKFKGCLYILINPKSSPLVVRHDWQHIKEIWPLLVRSLPSEKLSIINLMNKISDTVYRLLPTIAITYNIPDNCVNCALALASINPVCNIENSDAIIENGKRTMQLTCQTRKDAYNDTINALIDAVDQGKL